MKNRLLIFLAFFICNYVQSQDTLKLMHYNVLNYGINTPYCTTSNNNISSKDIYLSKIIRYVKPDVFLVNEIDGADSNAVQRVLTNVMNTNGISYYKRAPFFNISGAGEANMVYYNSSKLGLMNVTSSKSGVRDITFYRFYFKAADISTTHDTAYFTCITSHLKAGNTAADESERARETQILMGYLNYFNVDNNFTFSGDFNFYRNTEAGFQNLINYSNPIIRFYDPVNQLGAWTSNSTYENYHTQSTHSSSSSDCFASGGLDDRFDFILISRNIKDGLKKVRYVPGSYQTLGQDGNRFNEAVNASPSNSAVPQDIADALYGMSDHLPVILKLRINILGEGIYAVDQKPAFSVSDIKVSDGMLNFEISMKEREDILVNIHSLLGQTLYEQNFSYVSDYLKCSIPINDLRSNLFLLEITNKKNTKIISKFVKQ